MTHAFDAAARATIADAYPNHAASFAHAFGDHPLLSLDALAALGEALPPAQVEFNRSDIDVATLPEDAPANGLGIGDTIPTIADNRSWAVLKNIERVPAYAALLDALLAEIEDVVAPRTGDMLTRQGFVFVSSPGSMTPYHFDPEHNILLHLAGEKVMTVFPQADARYAAPEQHERYHAGGHRGLFWHEQMRAGGTPHRLTPGQAILVPVMAPHFVTVGDAPAISLSITWRSEWSYRESEAHVANHWLRQRGFSPSPPPRWPKHARTKTTLWRAARRLRLV